VKRAGEEKEEITAYNSFPAMVTVVLKNQLLHTARVSVAPATHRLNTFLSLIIFNKGQDFNCPFFTHWVGVARINSNDRCWKIRRKVTQALLESIAMSCPHKAVIEALHTNLKGLHLSFQALMSNESKAFPPPTSASKAVEPLIKEFGQDLITLLIFFHAVKLLSADGHHPGKHPLRTESRQKIFWRGRGVGIKRHLGSNLHQQPPHINHSRMDCEKYVLDLSLVLFYEKKKKMKKKKRLKTILQLH